MIETFKNDVRNGFGKAWQYSFKLQMLLSGVVYHLSFIEWFFSIETQKSSICHVFYDGFYKSICELSSRSSNPKISFESRETICVHRKTRTSQFPRKNFKEVLQENHKIVFGNLLWKFKISCSYKKLNREEMFFTDMMKNPQIQVHMKIWTYIVTIIYFSTCNSLRQT